MLAEEIEILGSRAHALERDPPEALRLLQARTEGWADVAPFALTLDEAVNHGLAALAERRSAAVKTLVDPSATARRADA